MERADAVRPYNFFSQSGGKQRSPFRIEMAVIKEIAAIVEQRLAGGVPVQHARLRGGMLHEVKIRAQRGRAFVNTMIKAKRACNDYYVSSTLRIVFKNFAQ